MDNINKVLKSRIDQSQITWDLHPFPHTVIDNFLPSDVFSKIIDNINHIDSFKDLKRNFQTHVEFKKNVYGDKDLNEFSKLPIRILGGPTVMGFFESFLNGQKLSSMCDRIDYGGYYPFHSMMSGGIIGAHVDHSHSEDGDLHVANSIFYVSPEWKSSWGGETLLFNSIGFKIIKKIAPLPNRLILFIHSASSFHGVNPILSPAGVKRSTYYVDYYINAMNLPQMCKTLKKKNCEKLVYSYHTTSFVPFFPLGIRSFRAKFIFMKSTYPYVKVFLHYLIFRFLLNNRLGQNIRKIKNFLKKTIQK